MTAPSFDNTNTGFFSLDGSSANQALLDVTTGAAGFGRAGTLTGLVDLAGDSAIEFASGQITRLAASGDLVLQGNDVFIEDSTALGSNSALKGLSDVAGYFYLYDGAGVSTTGALANDGTVEVEDGGSTLSIGGALTNSGTLDIGDSGLSSSDSVTAKSSAWSDPLAAAKSSSIARDGRS